jgi:hypothetical protein
VLALHRGRRPAAKNRGGYWTTVHLQTIPGTRQFFARAERSHASTGRQSSSTFRELQTEPLTNVPGPKGLKSSDGACSSVVPGLGLLTATRFHLPARPPNTGPPCRKPSPPRRPHQAPRAKTPCGPKPKRNSGATPWGPWRAPEVVSLLGYTCPIPLNQIPYPIDNRQHPSGSLGSRGVHRGTGRGAARAPPPAPDPKPPPLGEARGVQPQPRTTNHDQGRPGPLAPRSAALRAGAGAAGGVLVAWRQNGGGRALEARGIASSWVPCPLYFRFQIQMAGQGGGSGSGSAGCPVPSGSR